MAAVQQPPGVHLNLKLAVGVKHHRLDQMLAGAPGIESVIQTFPDETDDELSRLYVLEVSASQADAALPPAAPSAGSRICRTDRPAPPNAQNRLTAFNWQIT